MTSPSAPSVHVLRVNVNAETEAALLDYCFSHGVTVTEAVRQMIGTTAFLVKAEQRGERVLVRRPWRLARRLQLVPRQTGLRGKP